MTSKNWDGAYNSRQFNSTANHNLLTDNDDDDNYDDENDDNDEDKKKLLDALNMDSVFA